MNEHSGMHTKIRTLLNASAAQTEAHIQDRLYAARTLALAKQRRQTILRLADVSGISTDLWHDYARPTTWALAFVLLLAVANTWVNYQRIAEREDEEAALLADDLPIAAYLDRGFDAWLANNP